MAEKTQSAGIANSLTGDTLYAIANETMKSQLEKILEKYEFQKRNSKLNITIEFVENYFKVRFSEDYIFYLKNYLEFENFVNVEFVKLWSLENLIENNQLYEIQKYLSNIVAIGSNASGEIIGIKFDDRQTNSLILTPMILNEKDSIEIGNDFTDFLLRLDSGKNWFV